MDAQELAELDKAIRISMQAPPAQVTLQTREASALMGVVALRSETPRSAVLALRSVESS